MKASLSVLGVIALSAAFAAGCHHHSDSEHSEIAATQASAGEAANPADQEQIKTLLTKLQTDIQGKDWKSSADDVNQLTNLKGEMTGEEKAQLMKDQASIAIGSLLGGKK